MDFKNSHTNEACYILGSGPSLTEAVLRMVARKRMFTFVSNGFGLIFKKINIAVDAACMSNQDAIQKYLGLYGDTVLKFVKKIPNAAYPGAQNVFELPFDCEHDKGIHRNKFIKDGFFTADPFKENFCGETVILDFCLPLASYMGFKQIYLGGVDCDYTKGYFVDTYKKAEVPQLKGMINNDFSIAIPSYRFAYAYLQKKGVTIKRFTDSKRLSFIPFISFEEVIHG